MTSALDIDITTLMNSLGRKGVGMPLSYVPTENIAGLDLEFQLTTE